MDCPRCGHRAAQGDAFCGSCGQQLPADSAPAPVLDAATPAPPTRPPRPPPARPVEPAQPAPPTRRRRRRLLWLAVASAVPGAVLIITGVALLRNDDRDPGASAATPATSQESPATVAPSTAPTAAADTAVAPPTRTPGVLTVGSEIGYPPFEEYDSQGNVTGYDADVVAAMADRLGLVVQWVDRPFDDGRTTLLDRLGAGEFDIVAAALTITAEREQVVAFTRPYYLDVAFAESYGIAVDPANHELLAALDAALGDAIRDGTYQAIYNTWFQDRSGSVALHPPE